MCSTIYLFMLNSCLKQTQYDFSAHHCQFVTQELTVVGREKAETAKGKGMVGFSDSSGDVTFCPQGQEAQVQFQLLSVTACIAQLVKQDATSRVTWDLLKSLSSGSHTTAKTYLA